MFRKELKGSNPFLGETTLFLFRKKKTCAKRKNIFLGKAFLSKKRFVLKEE